MERCPGRLSRPSWGSEPWRRAPQRYTIEFSSHAARDFRKLSTKDQERIGARINALADDPRPNGVEKLEGEENPYRIRIGGHRVIYAIFDGRLIVLVLRIGKRGDIDRKK